MDDTPSGSGPPEDDRDRDPDRNPDRPDESQQGMPRDPFGFIGAGIPGMTGGLGDLGARGGQGGPDGAVDMGQLGQMLTQLGQMLSQAGTSSGPVNYDLAKRLALQQLGAVPAPTVDELAAVRDAFHLAELWLDPVTSFPAGGATVAAWSAQDWVEATLPTWQRLCDPVAQRVSGAWVEGLPAEAREMAGPMVAMLGQMGGLAFGSQLGSGLAQLSREVLTSTDIGLPLGPDGTAALLPAAIESFTTGLDRPASEVMVFLAAREAAHQRLFGHVSWLRQRLLAIVEEYARGITVDTSRIEELARDLDPADPSALEEAMRSGMFEPQTTPEQQLALNRLETLLALVEGWVDLVVAEAVSDRLPGAGALRETLRRRRASGGPAEQTFATLVGLELRPRRLRVAAELWQALTQRRGVEGRDAIWAHPDLMPSADDLDDPVGFAGREELDDDPMAQLENTPPSESSESSEPPESSKSSEPPEPHGPSTQD